MFVQNFVTKKKGTNPHGDGWDSHNQDWGHMVLHLPHAEGGFGVNFNDVTKDVLYYYVTVRSLAWCILPGTSGLVVAQG